MKDFIIDKAKVTTTFDLYCNNADDSKVLSWLTSIDGARHLRHGPQVKDMRVVPGKMHFIVQLPGEHSMETIRKQITDL